MSSFLVRLAERNNMASIAELVRAAMLDRVPGVAPSPAELGAISKVSGVSTEVLSTMAGEVVPGIGRDAVVLDGVKFPSSWIDPSPRFCPACLATTPHHRRRWHLRWLGACVVHSRALVGSCPACGDRFQWSPSCLRACRCGLRLSDVVTETWTEDRMTAMAWVGGLGSGAPAPRLLEPVAFVPAVELAARVGEVLLGMPWGEANKDPARVGAACLAAAFPALDGDLEDFDRTLVATLAGPSPELALAGLKTLRADILAVGNAATLPLMRVVAARHVAGSEQAARSGVRMRKHDRKAREKRGSRRWWNGAG